MHKELKKFLRVIAFFLLFFGCKILTGPTTPEVVFINTGDGPSDVCVNIVTNKIYVANSISANVSVIDGETNNTTTVAIGDNPMAISVNPTTNKVYVVNHDSDDVAVIYYE